jgi:hypothetical protein
VNKRLIVGPPSMPPAPSLFTSSQGLMKEIRRESCSSSTDSSKGINIMYVYLIDIMSVD